MGKWASWIRPNQAQQECGDQHEEKEFACDESSANCDDGREWPDAKSKVWPDGLAFVLWEKLLRSSSHPIMLWKQKGLLSFWVWSWRRVETHLNWSWALCQSTQLWNSSEWWDEDCCLMKAARHNYYDTNQSKTHIIETQVVLWRTKI